MRNFIAGAIVAVAALTASGTAFAACATASPDAITSKSAKAAPAGDQQAAKDAKGIAEDGQHMPLETDPNAPGVTTAEGGTTTNTQKAEAEIAVADTMATGSTTADAGMKTAEADTACKN